MPRPRIPTDKNRQTLVQLEYWLGRMDDARHQTDRAHAHRLMQKVSEFEKQLLEETARKPATP